MATALEHLDAALVNVTNAANNAATRIAAVGDSVPATDVQARTDAFNKIASDLQTAVNNSTPTAPVA